MTEQQSPRYWDLFAVIFLVLGVIALGEGFFYRHLLAARQARQAQAPVAEPAPVVSVVAAKPEPIPEPEPEPEKPKPYALKIRSRSQPAPGARVTYVVQGTDRAQMLPEVAADAFLAAFWGLQLNDPLKTAGPATRRTWAGWATKHIEEVKTDQDERGLVVTFRAEPETLRKALELQGMSFKRPTVPSFEINVNGSYAPEKAIIESLTAALRQNSPYYVGAAMFALPPLVEKEVGKLRLTLDDEPYAVNVVKTKDFGGTPVGQSVIFYVDIVPAG